MVGVSGVDKREGKERSEDKQKGALGDQQKRAAGSAAWAISLLLVSACPH